MRKIIFQIFFLIFTLAPMLSWADNNGDSSLNQVIYQLRAEAWATTQTAEITVTVNASLQETQLDQLRQQVITNLGKIAQAEWHIIQFNQDQDKSGLEQIWITAQARVPENQLNNLRNNAKSISKPGQTYTIASIQFLPSLDEIEKVKVQLRDNIYHKVTEELQRLNQIYPNEQFYLNRIDFTEAPIPSIQPRPLMFMGAAQTQNQAPLSVSNKIVVNANVIIANRIKEDNHTNAHENSNKQ